MVANWKECLRSWWLPQLEEAAVLDEAVLQMMECSQMVVMTLIQILLLAKKDVHGVGLVVDGQVPDLHHQNFVLVLLLCGLDVGDWLNFCSV